VSTVGALSLAAEIVIGGLLPIFILEYAGLDPRTIRQVDWHALGGGSGVNLGPFAVLPPGVAPPPLEEVVLLATIPLLANGVVSYLMIPLSIAVGRRPVLLLSCAAAWAGGIWAGLSSSLRAHIVARAIMGLGAGAVEALIPLIIQDIVFIHQRNKAMAAIVSSQVRCSPNPLGGGCSRSRTSANRRVQSVIIVAIGIAAPYIAANYTWRWLY